MRAVLTRDNERSSEYLHALAQRGITATCLPVTTTAAALDQPALLGAARVAASYDALGFASQASVRPFIAALTSSGGTIAKTASVVAVGAATQRALADYGVTATIALQANAQGLAATIVAQLTAQGRIGRGMPSRVLLPRAADGRDDAGIALRRAGLIADEVICYRTLARSLSDLTDQETRLLTELRAGAIATLCIFAPSQVAALATLLGTAGALPANLAQHIIAIGETTAQALYRAGISQVTIAQAPTPDALGAAAVLA